MINTYLHFMCVHYGLCGNAPVLLAVPRPLSWDARALALLQLALLLLPDALLHLRKTRRHVQVPTTGNCGRASTLAGP